MTDQNSNQKQLVSSWMFLGDAPPAGKDFSDIPSFYETLPYEKMDILYIGPGCVKTDSNGKKTFGIIGSEGQYGSLENRLKAVIRYAREANQKAGKSIKIVISQWWDQSNSTIWGDSLSVLEESDFDDYAQGVADFISNYARQGYVIDGYDVDYESWNVIETFPSLAKKIRTSIGNEKLFTVSPVYTSYLLECVNELSYVNMQNYGGSITSEFTKIFPADKLFYGISTEVATNNTDAYNIVQQGILSAQNLNGIHNWRLNSGNYPIESYGQSQLYDSIYYIEPSKT